MDLLHRIEDFTRASHLDLTLYQIITDLHSFEKISIQILLVSRVYIKAKKFLHESNVGSLNEIGP